MAQPQDMRPVVEICEVFEVSQSGFARPSSAKRLQQCIGTNSRYWHKGTRLPLCQR
jgi:hypothetical protein